MPFETDANAEHEDWIAVNVDTGCGGTIFPEGAPYGVRSKANVQKFRTATGEIVEVDERLKVDATDEWNRPIKISGNLGPVTKPLLSAGEVTNKGSDIFLSDADGGCNFLIAAGSEVQAEIRASIWEILERHRYRDAVPLRKEKNVYNVWMKTGRRESDRGALDLAVATQLGGIRQAKP